jgi:hypothetical protein
MLVVSYIAICYAVRGIQEKKNQSNLQRNYMLQAQGLVHAEKEEILQGLDGLGVILGQSKRRRELLHV